MASAYRNTKSKPLKPHKLSPGERFLSILVTREVNARQDSSRDGTLAIAGERLTISVGEAEELIARDLAFWLSGGILSASDPGRAWVARRNAQEEPLREQHGDIAGAPELAPGARIDMAESPLLWLHRRKNSAGHRMIGEAMFAAGERLRADFTYGNLGPSISTNWDFTGGSAGSKGPAELGDSALAARQRVRRAVEWLGPELSGIALDVCCFLKRLEDVERDRHWPARSAKAILSLALGRLARHYGYSDVAQGPVRPRRLKSGVG